MRNTVLMHRSHTPASGGAQTANEPAPGSKNETITAARDARAVAEGTLSAELTALRTRPCSRRRRYPCRLRSTPVSSACSMI
jgi:hypothetical protein